MRARKRRDRDRVEDGDEEETARVDFGAKQLGSLYKGRPGAEGAKAYRKREKSARDRRQRARRKVGVLA